ncbi:MAG: hypothetical protein EXR62_06975 [Chloroflexi bacterium]|nr:hypothetical protein [Chloroflexota bacterium]
MPVVQALEDLRVPYHIGGSVASTAWSFARTTNDADIVAFLETAHVAPFVAQLIPQGYYADEEAIQEAIQRRGSFNLFYYPTMFKVDIFVPIPRPFDESAQARARIIWTDDPPTQQIRIASPEDIIVQKLVWFQMGGEVSERQWLDVQAVLKVQGSELDQVYLRQWAARLGIGDLRVQALKEAGL